MIWVDIHLLQAVLCIVCIESVDPGRPVVVAASHRN